MVDGIITDIKPGDEEGTWIVIIDDGEEITITPGDDVLLVLDEEGNGYIFTQHGFHPHNPDGEDGGDDSNFNDPSNVILDFEGPISNIDKKYLYVVNSSADTLYDGHTKTYGKGYGMLNLLFKYDAQGIANVARSAVHCPDNFDVWDYRWAFKQNWRDSLKLSNIVWTEGVHSNSGVSSALFLEAEGVYDFSVEPFDVFDVMLSYQHLTDTLIKGDTLIRASALNHLLDTIKFRINVIESGILNFRPINEDHYLSYGFDDALSFYNQQSNDYGASLSIGGADYFVPWMGVLPNQEATISLQYISASPQLDSLIVLEASSAFVEILNFNENGEPAFTNKQLKLKVTDEDEFHINAYSISKGGAKTLIGKLNIESKAFDEDKIKRIKFIRLRRSDETEHFPLSPTQKQEMVDLINTYYKQAFLEFHLFDEGYQDTLSVPFSTNDSILPKDFNTIDALIPDKVANAFYVLIGSKGPERYAGYGRTPGNSTLIFVDKNNPPSDRKRTFVHELGHNLGLQHPFSNARDGEANVLSHTGRSLTPESSTQNIMDWPTVNDQRSFFWLFQINFIKSK